MSKKKVHFSAEYKATVVRRHLEEGVSISALANELDLEPRLIHLWVQQALEQGEELAEGEAAEFHRGGFRLTTILLLLALACLVLGATFWMGNSPIPPFEPPKLFRPVANESEHVRQRAQARCFERVRELHTHDLESIENCLGELDLFFEEARSHTKPLVQELISWSGSFKTIWYSAKDWWTGRNQVEEYVSEVVDRHVGIPNRLNTALDGFTEQLRISLNANEQRTYAAMAPDLEVAVPGLDLAAFREQLQQEVQRLVSQHAKTGARQAVGAKIAIDGVGFVAAALVTQKVLPTVLKSVGTSLAAAAGSRGAASAASGTALAAGAANSWWTAGTSLVAGAMVALAIEYLIGKITESVLEERFNDLLLTTQQELRKSLETELHQLMNRVRDERNNQLHQVFAEG